MPRLETIHIADFRNIEEARLSFSPNVNCIVGGNGEGKTNLLDAIFYLSMVKSFLGRQDRYNVRYGQSSFALCGQYALESGLKTRISLQGGGPEKILRRDDKAYKRFSTHIGLLPIVTVSPSDSALVSESGEERRRFADIVLSQMDAEYLRALSQYGRLLQQRNHLLKEPGTDSALLDVLDAQMGRESRVIYQARRQFTAQLLPVVADYYSRLSGGREEVSIRYRSELEQAPLEEWLLRGRERDFRMGFTGSGVQRDDFAFEMAGNPIRRCGSQGQQKTFLVALKFAQYEWMKQRGGTPPTLLLDDVFDKLDLNRTANLIAMVAQEDFGQIFITDCSADRLRPLVDGATTDRAYFHTQGGRFERI